MPLAPDITQHIENVFAESERATAIALLESAKTHDGIAAELRLQRCAIVAAGGTLKWLRHYVDLLKIDFRDVIVAGEYEEIGGKLVRARDLSLPIAETTNNIRARHKPSH